VIRPGVPPLWRLVRADGSYLSAGDLRVHFGLGTTPATGVLVDWPDGVRERWPALHSDTILTLREGAGSR